MPGLRTTGNAGNLASRSSASWRHPWRSTTVAWCDEHYAAFAAARSASVREPNERKFPPGVRPSMRALPEVQVAKAIANARAGIPPPPDHQAPETPAPK